jgi:tetratricopeptide (TPR) repeat protein
MSSPATWPAVGACALVVSLAAVAAPQTRLKGRVHTPGNDPLIAREQVTIEGAGNYDTDDHGEFDFDLVQGLKTGQPATFHVYHVNPAIKVKQWIVVRPCDLKNGRKDSLPDVGPEPISIVVLPRGDARLKSLNAEYSIIGCAIEELASEFKPASGSKGSNRSSVSYDGPPVLAEQVKPQPLDRSLKLRSSAGHPRVVEVVYREHFAVSRSRPSSQKPRNDSDPEKNESLARKAEELGFTTEELEEAIDVWAKAAEDLYGKGLAALYERRYAEASRLISRSIPSPPGDFLKRNVPLARAEYELGNYSAAETALRKVLVVHGDDPIVLNNLGVVLRVETKYSEAEPLYKRALAIDEKALRPDHPDVAIRLNNLASLYHDQGKYSEAEPLYKRALAIDEKALGPDHPTVATYLNNLAGLYDSQGKYAEAEPLYKRALAILEKALGPDHPNVAMNLNKLAGLYRAQAKYAEAEPLYKARWPLMRKPWDRITPTWRRTSTTWQNSTAPKASARRPNRFTSARWPSMRRHWGPIIPTWQRTSATWQNSTAPKTSTRRPSPSTSARWPLMRKHWGRITPAWR